VSKISEYLDRRRDSEKQANNETVAEFAASLNRTADNLIGQLKEAGVSVSGPDDQITEANKEVLLNYLRRVHALPETNRRIRIETRAQRLHRAIQENVSGAEIACLRELASNVIWEQPIDPLLQFLANTIVAKAVIQGSLPSERRGRPKDDGMQEFGETVAREFWTMRDSGTPYKNAIQTLSERYHKDERHLSRVIKSYTSDSWKTREGRDRDRAWWGLVAEFRRDHGPSQIEKIFARIDTTEDPEFSEQDCLDHLDEKLKRSTF